MRIIGRCEHHSLYEFSKALACRGCTAENPDIKDLCTTARILL
jgi:hypothetical protein